MAPNEFLPSHIYCTEASHRWDRSQYAGHWWHPVGSAWDLQPGHSLAVQLLGQQLLLTRPDEGPPMAFRNRCPHRGVAFAIDGRIPTRCRRLICPYHGWTYNLRGELLAAAREQTMLTGFERSEWNLEPLPCQVDGPLIWVSLDSSAVPLNQQLTQLHQEVDQAWRKPLVQVGSDSQLLRCNWKIAHDNTLDDYHVAIAHPTTLHREQGPVRHYTHRFSEFSNLLVTPHPDGGEFFTFGMPPWTHVLVWPDERIVLLEFLPDQATSCRMQMRLFAPSESLSTIDADQWLADMRSFLNEDRVLVESAQLGYSTGLKPGPAHRLERRILHWQAIYRSLNPSALA